MSKSLKLDFCFILRIFFYRNWWFIGQSGEGGDHLLFHVTTSTRSQTLRHLFATLQMRWLHVFLIATLEFTRLLLDEIYHLIELPSDWLLADEMFVCLLNELVLGFCYSDFDMGNQWIWTRIEYYPCVTSKSSSQVLLVIPRLLSRIKILASREFKYLHRPSKVTFQSHSTLLAMFWKDLTSNFLSISAKSHLKLKK